LAAVGENRVQEPLEKRAQTQAAVRWELIGHSAVQQGEAGRRTFGRIQSVDSEKRSTSSTAPRELGRKLPCCSRSTPATTRPSSAPTGGRPTPARARPGKAHLQVDGLMTMRPLSADPAVARRTFAEPSDDPRPVGRPRRRSAARTVHGMSGDLDAAVAEAARWCGSVPPFTAARLVPGLQQNLSARENFPRCAAAGKQLGCFSVESEKIHRGAAQGPGGAVG